MANSDKKGSERLPEFQKYLIDKKLIAENNLYVRSGKGDNDRSTMLPCYFIFNPLKYVGSFSFQVDNFPSLDGRGWGGC